MPKFKRGGSVFVRGLAFSTSDEGLTQAFSLVAPVKRAFIVRDGAHTSRGFGFVQFAFDEDAALAVSKLHGTTLDGRTISVEVTGDKPGEVAAADDARHARTEVRKRAAATAAAAARAAPVAAPELPPPPPPPPAQKWKAAPRPAAEAAAPKAPPPPGKRARAIPAAAGRPPPPLPG